MLGKALGKSFKGKMNENHGKRKKTARESREKSKELRIKIEKKRRKTNSQKLYL